MARTTKAESLAAVNSPILYSKVFDHNTFEYSVKEGEVRYRKRIATCLVNMYKQLLGVAR